MNADELKVGRIIEATVKVGDTMTRQTAMVGRIQKLPEDDGWIVSGLLWSKRHGRWGTHYRALRPPYEPADDPAGDTPTRGDG